MAFLVALLLCLATPAKAQDSVYFPIVGTGPGEPVYGPLVGRYMALTPGEWLQVFCAGPVTFTSYQGVTLVRCEK